MDRETRPLPPGATIGILGNGQLGRMLALAAARLGYKTHVYGPDKDSPAEQVATASTVAAYENAAALIGFAAAVDAVTFEFENVPVKTAHELSSRLTVRPGPKILEIAQDRIKEKQFFAAIGAGTPAWAIVNQRKDLDSALQTTGTPAVLKTARLGYDGKGQAKIKTPGDADAAWAAITGGKTPAEDGFAVLEAFVDFRCEISVIVARAADGQVVPFEPAENEHSNHILSSSFVPARIDPATAKAALAIATRAAEALDLVGLLAVEMFVTASGDVLCNEMAPRSHNSGHWTMDAGGVDQFEQLVRAVAGLPLLTPVRHADVTMVNLIGDDVNKLDRYLKDESARVHLYGKSEARPGRKMGHVNLLKTRGR
ncbi:MAG: 5-(carboxyamino)imidazole ribonucleotide synthase [Rhodospirillaceae bacterium]|nr:5-(carboxyamino)imidazole ribonucleotide synthase [Rhodospirillaceae bacterium]